MGYLIGTVDANKLGKRKLCQQNIKEPDMNKYFRHDLTSAAALVLSAIFVTGTAAQPAFATAMPTHYTSTYRSNQSSGWNDPLMADIAVSSGRALVNHLRSAKAALYAGYPQSARGMLLTSAEFADGLKRMIPNRSITDDVRTQSQTGDSKVVYSDLLPVYTGLDELEQFAPQTAAYVKAQLKLDQQGTRQGIQQAIQKSPQKEQKNQPGNTGYRDFGNEIAAVTVYMPVNYIDAQVHSALNALEHTPGDTAAAEKAVDNALNNMVAEANSEVITP